MTHRTFISLILAAALAVTGMTAAPAQAGDKDVAKWVAGAVALGLIGAAIADQRRDDRAVTRHQGGHGPRFNNGHRRGHDRYDNRGHRRGHDGYGNRGRHGERFALPQQCRRDVRVRGGVLRGYGRHCLLNTYPRFNALPHRCAVETRGHGRRDVIYGSQCLERYGFNDRRSDKYRK
ncbi:hypothetical protein [Roseovarius sp.]|uniref:hypothetical protein n=1 Tax=Roseovarius sp. TaxID=1486281 RepID=UPI003D11CDA8